MVGPTTTHAEKGPIEVAKDGDLSILIWEEVRDAHRSKKEKQGMSLFQWFVTDGKETAGEQQCWMEQK